MAYRLTFIPKDRKNLDMETYINFYIKNLNDQVASSFKTFKIKGESNG